MGMTLPYSSSTPAQDPKKMEECLRAGEAIRHLLQKDLKPKDIMTKPAFENAVTVGIALGGKKTFSKRFMDSGSTNLVLHIIAMARTVGISFTLEDIQRLSDRVPYLADLKPR